MWHLVYSYANAYRQLSNHNSLYTTIVCLVILIVLSIFMIITAELKKRHIINQRFLFVLVLAFGFMLSLQDQLKWSRERKALAMAASSEKCIPFVGRLEEIANETGDGKMSFKLGNNVFRYNNHSLALSDQLCSPGGPMVCVNDVARVCIHNRRDGEIVSIMKMVE